MFLLYIDDIVLTGNSPTFIQSFITTLGREFELKDLGKLHYFLGIEVSYLSTGVCLTQNKYTLEILKQSNLLECKSCSTPLAAKQQLYVHSDSPLPYASLYRQLIEALQYLTLTRSDISYVVQMVSQFMGSPTSTTDHMDAVKCILRYLKGTLGKGLCFIHSPLPLRLVAYSDAD